MAKNNSLVVVSIFSTIMMSTFIHSLPLLCALTGGALLLARIVGTPYLRIAKRMLLLLPFGLGTVILVPIHHTGGYLFAFTLWCKMMLASLLLTTLLHVITPAQLWLSFKRLGMPELLVDVIQMIWRYFFLLKDEAFRMLRAQRARGLQWGRWYWSRAMYTRFGEFVGCLFIRALRRSERVYRAMAARGGWQSFGIIHPKQRMIQGGIRLALELKQVNYYYGDIHALQDISLAVRQGTKVALMGHNGAGKSTLISLLNGLELPHSGEIHFFNEKWSAKYAKQMRQKVGVVYQDPDDQLFSSTVAEDVAFGPRNLGLSEDEVSRRVHESLSAVGLQNEGHRSPHELSYGQKRRVAIAGVLAMHPEVIILDEPMAFLDPRGQDGLRNILDQLHAQGLTIIIATHDSDFAVEWADEVVILQAGRVRAQGDTHLLYDTTLTREVGLHNPRHAQPAYPYAKGFSQTSR